MLTKNILVIIQGNIMPRKLECRIKSSMGCVYLKPRLLFTHRNHCSSIWWSNIPSVHCHNWKGLAKKVFFKKKILNVHRASRYLNNYRLLIIDHICQWQTHLKQFAIMTLWVIEKFRKVFPKVLSHASSWVVMVYHSRNSGIDSLQCTYMLTGGNLSKMNENINSVSLNWDLSLFNF